MQYLFCIFCHSKLVNYSFVVPGDFLEWAHLQLDCDIKLQHYTTKEENYKLLLL
jgi:hypothetical protein